jgi:hypothetical protein
VRRIIGPVLEARGFVMDYMDDQLYDGDGQSEVVFYRSSDCKVQSYLSSRAGEVNAMIAPLNAPNVFGLLDHSGKWQYFARFITRPDLSITRLARLSTSTYEIDEERVESVRNRILENYPSAHAGILKMFGRAE